MLVEQAFVEVVAGMEGGFELAVASVASSTLLQADGFLSWTIRRGLERPSLYTFVVEWNSLDQHSQFRESDSFTEWRRVISPFFASPPTAEHWVPIEVPA